jgi:hypothetical protein
VNVGNQLIRGSRSAPKTNPKPHLNGAAHSAGIRVLPVSGWAGRACTGERHVRRAQRASAAAAAAAAATFAAAALAAPLDGRGRMHCRRGFVPGRLRIPGRPGPIRAVRKSKSSHELSSSISTLGSFRSDITITWESVRWSFGIQLYL